MLQMSTSAHQTTETVALMPAVPTLRVTSRVPVYLDSPEMDSPAQVNYRPITVDHQKRNYSERIPLCNRPFAFDLSR